MITLVNNSSRKVSRRLVLPAVALGVLALAAACGGSGDDSSAGTPSQSAAHNASDVTFATGMIPHHAQALEMAEMAISKATDPEIKTLAQAISGAQDPEIATMTGWLNDWDEPAPDTGGGHSMSMGAGMMSDAEMASLEKATGSEFDTMWVGMMTRHHAGAVDMANMEIKDGEFADAKALAQRIVTSQSAEITKMGEIAKRLG